MGGEGSLQPIGLLAAVKPTKVKGRIIKTGRVVGGRPAYPEDPPLIICTECGRNLLAALCRRCKERIEAGAVVMRVVL